MIIASATFSTSPGLTPSLPLNPANLPSLASILLSSCAILSLSSLSRLSNMSLTLTSPSRCLFRSSSTPASHALLSSSRSACPVLSRLLSAARPSFSSGTSLASVAYVSALASVRDASERATRPWSAATPSVRLTRRSMTAQTAV